MHPGHDLAMLLRRAYLAFHRRMNTQLRRRGVTADQFVVLTVLSQEEGITQKMLVTRTSSDPNTVAALLRLLERRGAIRREIHATDGRARCVFLTTAGRRLQRQAAKDAAALLEALWTTIPAEPRGTMLRSLAEVEARFGVGRR